MEVIRTITGDNAIAIQRIHILIINTSATTINGIHIAITCHKDRATFNNAENTPVSDGITPLHEFKRDEYNAVNTPTYDFQFNISCNLLVLHHDPVHLL